LGVVGVRTTPLPEDDTRISKDQFSVFWFSVLSWWAWFSGRGGLSSRFTSPTLCIERTRVGHPGFLVIRRFSTWSFDLVVGLESCRGPSLGVARGRGTPLPQDDTRISKDQFSVLWFSVLSWWDWFSGRGGLWSTFTFPTFRTERERWGARCLWLFDAFQILLI
jgi:hypothetical protein